MTTEASAKRIHRSRGPQLRKKAPRLRPLGSVISAVTHDPSRQLKALCAIIAANSDPDSAHDLHELQSVARLLWQRAMAL
eukprot:12039111-Heterocapsa_arctica.AAC.1